MRFTHVFVDRPIFAAVVSILITIIGAIAYIELPVAQYPEVAPPTVTVTASYPGASAEIVADTVAAPLEQQINGVEDMLYMSSQSTADGNLTITITFQLGTDLDQAQVLVQNRVAIAEASLPEEVRRLGITTQKSSPDMLMVIHLVSPGNKVDLLYLSNYAVLQVQDVLSRVNGVGDVRLFGAREYSMRIWIDPDRAAALELTPGEIVDALRAQNVQVASGILNQPPTQRPGAFQLNLETQGRLIEPKEFANIVIKTDGSGRVTRVRDVARVEVGAVDYSTIGYLDEDQALPLLVFQRPGSNALETAVALRATMQELAANFPEGLEYRIVYDPTEFIAESVREVYKTIFEAVALVVVVVILFLKTWRASIIPIIAIPVSLIGTFAVMSAIGFSLNNLSLFGLVLAIGIVVDDAIVVVENVERNLALGMTPREAAHRTMDEVGTALVAIALVLIAVFVPTAFITGISGQFYRQFALTIASATAISCIVSLTLSPALAALLLKPHSEHGKPNLLTRPIHAFFRGFDRVFDAVAGGYAGLTRRLVRLSAVVLVVYVGLIGLTWFQLERTPGGFIPEQDQGYLITVVQLPPGSSLDRTDQVVRKVAQMVRDTPGVEHTVAFSGFDGATFTNNPSGGAIFSPLKPFTERAAEGLDANTILGDLRQRLGSVQEAMVFSLMPPPVRGIGTGGGFKMMVQDRNGRGLPALEEATQALAAAAKAEPGLVAVFSLFNTQTPKVYADIDRVAAEMLEVPASRVFEALEVYLGSAYVNDYNLSGRTFRVTAQADWPFRGDTRDVGRLRTRSDTGAMVPLGSIATFRDITGPYRVARYNLYPAAELQGSTLPGTSSAESLSKMERLANEVLPNGFAYQWTELSLQEKLAGNTAVFAFAAAVVFVFLVLAALYESWLLPLAVVLIVPMCILAAMTGVLAAGFSNDILVQVGLVVLIGLAAKNAILIVEFAKQAEERGMSRMDAAVEAARTRLRPIVMTSMAFILGVVPLMLSTGAGAEMRRTLGTTVFSGMLGVTLFGLLFTPVFYVVCRWLGGRRGTAATSPATPAPAE
ncbi:MAG TPA: multidrug efflux RND transporter permease subunit [Geminicoccus sp.]|jgi:HAE1 family hydrophobic/amphiphilic exporter-1|uniref:efflux RND transporter permease subunit n=1 Tax=Geminicoccus sp. TaxID=2024832 RepID=UPI002E34E3D3|nr:multidrug efflux RND transporter permease subunit [Geminicoccus sp.]HEX2525408.1 multidrug efflux RND transporter permease subunit [Geminicoccus sp.]